MAFDQKARVEGVEHGYDGGSSNRMPPLNTMTVNLDHCTRERTASAME